MNVYHKCSKIALSATSGTDAAEKIILESRKEQTTMKKYEYKFERCFKDKERTQKIIVDMGFYGWQMHTVQPIEGVLVFWREVKA